MRRAGWVLLFVGVAFAAFAASGAQPVLAFVADDLAIIDLPANDSALATQLLKYPATESGLTGLSVDAASGVAEAEMAAGITTGALANVAIPVTAGATSYLVTKEVLHLTGGDTFFYRLFGGTATSTTGATNV